MAKLIMHVVLVLQLPYSFAENRSRNNELMWSHKLPSGSSHNSELCLMQRGRVDFSISQHQTRQNCQQTGCRPFWREQTSLRVRRSFFLVSLTSIARLYNYTIKHCALLAGINFEGTDCKVGGVG